jgi:hypothetical protein
MSSRKRKKGPRKLSLRVKLLACAALFLGPTLLGGACGVASYATPKRNTFGGENRAGDTQPADRAAITRGITTGAVIGVVVGVAACGLFLWGSREKKRPF